MATRTSKARRSALTFLALLLASQSADAEEPRGGAFVSFEVQLTWLHNGTPVLGDGRDDVVERDS